MRKFFKNIFYMFWPKVLPADRAIILMYHSVSDDAEYFSNISPSDFERQMNYLKKQECSVISLAELVRRLWTGESLNASVAITFDDGYKNNYEKAYPILKAYGFPATIFLTTGKVGTRDEKMPYVSESELGAMESSGLISIEPHTVSHPKLATLSVEDARKEIEDSKAAVERLLHKTARFFAYPFGNYNQPVIETVREAGFEGAVTVREGSVGSNANPYLLPRVSIDQSTTFAQFRGKLTSAVDWYERIKSLWR